MSHRDVVRLAIGLALVAFVSVACGRPETTPASISTPAPPVYVAPTQKEGQLPTPAGSTPSQAGAQLPTPGAPQPRSATQRTAARPDWGPEFNSAGSQLALEEVQREATQNGTQLTYKLLTSGFPQGKTYTLWRRTVDESPKSLLSGLQADGSGTLVAEDGYPLQDIPLVMAKYVKGEAVEVGIIADDGSVKAFAATIPFPIEAQGSGGCHLSVQLLSAKGTLFAILGDGFQPGEEVEVTDQSDGEVIKSKTQADSEGMFSVFESPGVTGKESGTASYTATGKACSVQVTYAWGPDAIVTQ